MFIVFDSIRFPKLAINNYLCTNTQTVNDLPAVQETRIQFLDREGPTEKEMATHSRKYSCLENSMDRGT